MYTGQQREPDADVLFAPIQTLGQATHLERFPRHPAGREALLGYVLCGLGEALLQLGKTTEARRALARALALRPGWTRPAGLLRQLAGS